MKSNPIRNFFKLATLLALSSVLISCSQVNTVKPSFSKYSNKVTKNEFVSAYSDSFLEYMEETAPFDSNKQLTKGFEYSSNISTVQTLSGTDINGVKISYKGGSSLTKTQKYDHKTKVSLLEGKTVTEVKTTGVEEVTYAYSPQDATYLLDVVSQSGYEEDTTVTENALNRTQLDSESGNIYTIDQITKTYTQSSIKDIDSFDSSIVSSVNLEFVLLALTVLMIDLDGGPVIPTFYIDNDNTLFTLKATAKDHVINRGIDTDCNIKLTIQVNFKKRYIGLSNEVTIKSKEGKQNVKFQENTYLEVKVDYKRVSVVKANLNSFTKAN